MIKQRASYLGIYPIQCMVEIDADKIIEVLIHL